MGPDFKRLMLFPSAVPADPAVAAWFEARHPELGGPARGWFQHMRDCGTDVRELLHDGHPTACVGEAAFAYTNAFRTHLNVGFFHGATLPDPAGILEGTGKYMRHVKVIPGTPVNESALAALIIAAYRDMKAYAMQCAAAASSRTAP